MRLRLFAAVAALLSGFLVFTAPVAGAATLDATCTGTTATGYSPGLLLLTERATLVSQSHVLGVCTSQTDPAVKSATSFSSGLGLLSCLSLGAAGNGTQTITWNTGETTTFFFNRTRTVLAGLTSDVLNGVVLSGKFRGDGVTVTVNGLLTNPLTCLGAQGLTTASGPVTIAITST
ncbi:hypothetical protein [Actinokineospora sp. NBRC 105648]|uniref:hypothetical protein n=1 Tax=Actinokineospora sp. NBRC 105648 TaxID=3032206 RepID=UPI0024A18838|nr:hypothetical protein [Actinokineospora sp. NBRC 105648]GLZ37075.1 hypothetical protein Acsp05_07000 [Actinokineospora sp. NBRC 105648]